MRFSKVKLSLRKYFLLLCLILTTHVAHAQDTYPPLSDTANIEQYNARALQYLNTAHYDECLEVLQKALKKPPNFITYFLLTRFYNAQYNWQEAIKAGEQSVKMDTSFKSTSAELFKAYYQSERYDDAMRVSEDAIKNDREGVIPYQVKAIEAAMVARSFSTPVLIFLLMILAVVFFYPAYKASTQGKSNYFSPDSDLRFSEILLVSASVSCIFWLFFFAIADWVWAQHPHIAAYEFAVYVRIFIFERDGMESVVLYGLMFANVFTTLLVMPLLLKLRSKQSIYFSVYSVLFLLSAYYFFKIGFAPPISAISLADVYIPVVITLGALGIYVLYQSSGLLAKICVVALAAFVGFISLGPPSLTDLSYILDPALRLMHGFKVKEIYFQYDLFLSGIAWVWMKMGWEIMLFPYVGQVSFFLFFIGIFFFSDSYFKNKGLSVLFIVALMIMRFYTIWGDHPTIFQVTPIRLDLWLILVWVAWKKGIRHWLVGMCVGLLVLFHRNLGLIYMGAYVELLLMLFLVDIIPLVQQKELSVKSVAALFMKHLRMNLVNIVFILSSIALCFILFQEMFSASALIYRKLGVGMLPISRLSFYWYVAVAYSSLVCLLVYYRSRLGDRYISIGLFIVFLAIGNSMYFFGRSHENNILNVAGILALVMFVLFDVLIYLAPAAIVAKKNESQPKQIAKNAKKVEVQPAARASGSSFLTPVRMYLGLPLLFLFFASFYYSDRIREKVDIQYTNLQESNFTYNSSYMPADTAAIREITRNSPKVYFQDFSIDFYYYYYGNYAPQGYFSPCASWVYKKDVLKFLQGLLDDHYYIVVDSLNFNTGGEYFPFLDYNRSVSKNKMIALSKEKTTLLLPESPASKLHIGLVDSMSGQAIERAKVNVNEEFTLEVILKPMGPQSRRGVVISSLVSFDGLKGFTMQVNDSVYNQFVFGIGIGTQSIPNTTFILEDNKWNYVTVIVNSQLIKIYGNGKLLAGINTGGVKYVNGNSPIIIGNSSTRDGHFKGYIKEVKITDGNKNETEIISTGQALYNQLNAVR